MYNLILSLLYGGLKCAAVFGTAYLLVKIADFWRNQIRLYEKGNKFPGPKAFPLFGNALLFRKTRTAADTFTMIVELMNMYESTFRFWVGWELFVFVQNPQDAQVESDGISFSHLMIVLTKALAKPPIYKMFIAQKGSLVAPLHIWKKHRKLLTPAFNTKVLKTYMEVFTAQSANLCHKLNSKVDEPQFDVYDLVSRSMLDIVFDTAMGAKLESEEDKSIVGVWSQLFETGSKRIFSLLLRSEFIFKRTRLGIEFAKAEKLIYKLTEGVLKKKKLEASLKSQVASQVSLQSPNTRKGSKINKRSDVERSSPKRLTIMDLLLEAEERLSTTQETMTDNEVRDEIVIVMIAGSDTTSTETSSALVMLGMHPEVQDKVYVELFDIFGNSDRLPEVDDLKMMVYLERVIKESMRLFPVTAIIIRGIDEDLELSNKSVVPRGASCCVSLWKIHRDPCIWPEPTRFDPDRFLPEQVAKRHPYSYMPFSAGPRNCIALKYAMMSMLVMLSTILRQYKVHCDYKMEDIKMEFHSLSRSTNGYRLRLERRS